MSAGRPASARSASASAQSNQVECDFFISQRVHGTDDAHRPFVENMRVDHRGLDVGVAEQRLNGADVLARLLYHLAVEEDHGIERLILSGCGDLLVNGQMFKESADVGCLQSRRFAPAVKGDVAPDPGDVGLFRGVGVVFDA